MNSVENMSWNDKFALIDKFNPSDEMICMAFGVTPNELKKARELRAVGTLASNGDLDASVYADTFSDSHEQTSISVDTVSFSKTIQHLYDADLPAESATKKYAAKPSQKRGRKGDKISIALSQVSPTPEPVEQFMQRFGVSLAVLRQAKRFIANMSTEEAAVVGKVVVKQDKDTKILMIWREEV